MYLTPIRIVALALPAVLVLVLAACGQVTGLSDDYQYDLEGGAKTDGATGDGAKTDGATSDGATDAGVDATNKCSAGQTLKASQKMDGLNGSQLCKTCLAGSCCNDIDTCTSNPDCNHVFSCKLDCTEKPTSERTQCFKSCTISGGPSPVYQATIGACGAAACTKECGLN